MKTVATSLVAVCLIVKLAWGGDAYELHLLSSRADTVSGGSALVQAEIPPDPSGLSTWNVTLNGRDVSSEFRRTSDGAAVTGVVSGLKLGQNLLEMRVGGAVQASLQLINHSINGPIFSGMHQAPFVCQTDENGMGPARNADCDAGPIVAYYYKSTTPALQGVVHEMIRSLQIFEGTQSPGVPVGFRPYDPDRPAQDVAQTTTTSGTSVPYIIRRERGVINRAVYDIRFLHSPNDPLPSPWRASRGHWNGRLVYAFGGGCNPGFRQGTLQGPSSHEALLAEGYAVATSTLNIFGNGCNGVVSAETLSMVKEHFIKSFGKPLHTIGWGDSGGAMQQYLIAQDYPGLLDGIIPVISFPDVTTYIMESSDCPILLRAFDGMKAPLTDKQKTAVSGFATWRTCVGFGGLLKPRECPAIIARDQGVNGPVPSGRLRCDIFDNEVNIVGKDPTTGFARRPLDNVGVQYGLAPFNGGEITVEQFVELNEQVGGYNEDGELSPRRTEASIETLNVAYRNGTVLTGEGALRDIPIIDWRWYSDDLADAHDSRRSFVTRARLEAAGGSAGNQVIWMDPRAVALREMVLDLSAAPDGQRLLVRRERDLVQEMDAWLGRIEADDLPGAAADKVVRNKPLGLSDSCWATDGDRISGASVFGVNGRCSQIYPVHGDPRIAAGGPLADDVLKCVLKPIDATAYGPQLSIEQLRRLKAVFPAGVCDYSRPGIGQSQPSATWQHY